jgi:hypothetical protein
MWQRLIGGVWALLASITIVTVPVAWGFTNGPEWTIGRAVIIRQQRPMSMTPALYLKLSLRNVGVPGRMPVRIFGRWAKAKVHRNLSGSSTWQQPLKTTPVGNAGRWAMPNKVTPRAQSKQSRLPSGMHLLGQYNREVSLNQTAIIEVQLGGLGRPRRDTTRLEVVVMTASTVTDHQFVRLMPD